MTRRSFANLIVPIFAFVSRHNPSCVRSLTASSVAISKRVPNESDENISTDCVRYLNLNGIFHEGDSCILIVTFPHPHRYRSFLFYFYVNNRTYLVTRRESVNCMFFSFSSKGHPGSTQFSPVLACTFSWTVDRQPLCIQTYSVHSSFLLPTQ